MAGEGGRRPMLRQGLYEQFLGILEAEDREGCVRWVQERLNSGELDIVALYEDILAPSLNKMVCRDEEARICVWREHVRSSIVRTVIESCYLYVLEERDRRMAARGGAASERGPEGAEWSEAVEKVRKMEGAGVDEAGRVVSAKGVEGDEAERVMRAEGVEANGAERVLRGEGVEADNVERVVSAEGPGGNGDGEGNGKAGARDAEALRMGAVQKVPVRGAVGKGVEGSMKRGRAARRAAVLCPTEEYHELGARMVADFLTICGYDVTFVGANTPLEDFIAGVQLVRPEVVAVSVTNPYSLVATRRTISALREALGEGARVVVGGNAFRSNPGLFRETGADALLQTFADIEKFAGVGV
ncbi:MAG: cobalamin B12-binding domain-containing protein [Thermoplasmata archaeon]